MNDSDDTEQELIDGGYDGEEFIPVVVFVATTVVVGLFGNTCATVFYGWKAHKSVIQVFVLSLSLNDLSSNVIFLIDIVDLIHHVEAYRSNVVCKLVYVLKHWVVANSLLFMAVISAERYHRVNYPFSRQITPRVAWCIILGVLIVSFLIAVPAFVIADVVRINIAMESNVTVRGYHCMLSGERKLVLGKSEFHIMDIGIHTLILCSLVVFYSLIVRHIFITRKLVKLHGNVNISYKRKPSHNSNMESSSTNIVDMSMDGDSSASHDCPAGPKAVEQGRNRGVDNPMHECSKNSNDIAHVRAAETVRDTARLADNGNSREHRRTLMKKLSSTFQTNRTELRITIMTAVMTALSIACFVPYYIEMSDDTSPDLNAEWPTIQVGEAIARRTYMLNSAINPFILVAFHTEFKQFLVVCIRHRICSIFTNSNS